MSISCTSIGLVVLLFEAALGHYKKDFGSVFFFGHRFHAKFLHITAPKLHLENCSSIYILLYSDLESFTVSSYAELVKHNDLSQLFNLDAGGTALASGIETRDFCVIF